MNDKGYIPLIMRRNTEQIFKYCMYHELTRRFYPCNGEKRYFAWLIEKAGRGQHFIDTIKTGK